MGDRVAALLNDEAVPIALVLSIKFVLDLTSYVAEMRLVVVFKCFQGSYDGALNFVDAHVGSLDEHFAVCAAAKGSQGVGVVAGNHGNRTAIAPCNSKRLNSGWRNVNHVFLIIN